MKKQAYTTQQERKLKFAEAGVLFVLVLALTVFIGARLASRDDNGSAPEVAVQVDATPIDTEPAANETIATHTAPTHRVEVAAEPVVDTEPVAAARIPEQVTYALAEETYFTGDYSLAADLFDRYADEHPNNAWGYYMLGLSEWRAGQTDAAEEAFVAALELKPDHAKSLINYGRVLIDLDRAGEAEAFVAKALVSEPGNLDAQRVMGRILHTQGRLEDAAASYLAVLAERQDDVWSLNNLGLIRIQQERFDDAVAPLAKAAGMRADAAVIQNNLGVALERMGHLAAAAQAYTAALESDGAHERAEISLARVESRSADDDRGEIDLAALVAAFTARPVELAIEMPDSEPVPVPVEFAAVEPDEGVEVATTVAADETADDEDPDLP